MSVHVGNVIFLGLQKPINVAIDKPITVKQLKKVVFRDQVRKKSTIIAVYVYICSLSMLCYIQSDTLYLCRGGCPLSDKDFLTPSSDVLVLSTHLRLCGGKGGVFIRVDTRCTYVSM